MTKVIRFLYVYRSLEGLLSKRPIYIQIRALALAFQLARAPPARCKGCRSVATKSLFKNQWTELWTKLSVLQPSFYSLNLVESKRYYIFQYSLVLHTYSLLHKKSPAELRIVNYNRSNFCKVWLLFAGDVLDSLIAS